MRVPVRKGEFLLKCTFSVLFWKTVMISTLLNLVFFNRILIFFQYSHCYYVHVVQEILVLPKSLSRVILQFQSVMSEATSTLLPTSDAGQPPLQSGLMNFQRFEIFGETKLTVSLGNEQKTDWRTKPLILGIKVFRTTTTCHFFSCFHRKMTWM